MERLRFIWNVVTVLLVAALVATAVPFSAFGSSSQALAVEPRTWHVDDDL